MVGLAPGRGAGAVHARRSSTCPSSMPRGWRGRTRRSSFSPSSSSEAPELADMLDYAHRHREVVEGFRRFSIATRSSAASRRPGDRFRSAAQLGLLNPRRVPHATADAGCRDGSRRRRKTIVVRRRGPGAAVIAPAIAVLLPPRLVVGVTPPGARAPGGRAPGRGDGRSNSSTRATRRSPSAPRGRPHGAAAVAATRTST